MHPAWLLTGSIMLTLAACDAVPEQQGGSGPPGTMTLLAAGDPKVCVDRQVEQTLRKMIRPDGATPDRFAITLSEASLSSFDKVVRKATCDANLKVSARTGDTLVDTSISYAVAPSARQPDTFLVTALTRELQQQLVAAMTAEDELKAQNDAEAAETNRLVGVVTPRWIIGRWVGEVQGSNACIEGPFLDFRLGNVLRGPTATGSWTLAGTTLRLITATSAATIQVSNADAGTMELSSAEGVIDSYRRCTNDDRNRYLADRRCAIGGTTNAPAMTTTAITMSGRWQRRSDAKSASDAGVSATGRSASSAPASLPWSSWPHRHHRNLRPHPPPRLHSTTFRKWMRSRSPPTVSPNAARLSLSSNLISRSFMSNGTATATFGTPSALAIDPRSGAIAGPPV